MESHKMKASGISWGSQMSLFHWLVELYRGFPPKNNFNQQFNDDKQYARPANLIIFPKKALLHCPEKSTSCIGVTCLAPLGLKNIQDQGL